MAAINVKVSPKSQMVIPKQVREAFRLKPGEELQIYLYDGTMYMLRKLSIKDLRGTAPGMRWNNEDRDHSERF